METEDFKPIRPVRVSAEVAEQLKQAILTGRYKAGDKLPAERVLAERFGVSRLSIREALRSLETFGFLSTRYGANGGVFVTDLTFENLVNAFGHLFESGKGSFGPVQQLRFVIEPEVARLAALASTPADVERLREAYKAEQAHRLALPDRAIINGRVHLILAEMCENPFFEGIVRSALRLTSLHVTSANLDGKPYHPHDMHGPIIEAVAAGDAEAAYSAMQKHVTEFGEILLKFDKAASKKTRRAGDPQKDR
jgi:GntR family transcriptional regulator, transcriptional repressor for pyruvate dehydrogenase complex